MSFRAYVCGSRQEAGRARVAMEQLRANGIEVLHGGWVDLDPSDTSYTEARCKQGARECYEAIREADVVLWLIPDRLRLSYGSPADFGMAVGLGKPCVASGQYEAASCAQLASFVTSSDGTALDWILALQDGRKSSQVSDAEMADGRERFAVLWAQYPSSRVERGDGWRWVELTDGRGLLRSDGLAVPVPRSKSEREAHASSRPAQGILIGSHFPPSPVLEEEWAIRCLPEDEFLALLDDVSRENEGMHACLRHYALLTRAQAPR